MKQSEENKKPMKTLTALIKTLIYMVFIAFCAVVATFFISIFKPDGVRQAIEIFQSLW